jgi:hypothetical protein
MINPEDQLNDAFLHDLLQAAPLESPGDDFVSKVMAGIEPLPALVPAKKPFFMDIRSWWPYALAGSFVILFLLTSDLPYSRFIPGKEFFAHTLIPNFLSMFSGVKNLFSGSKSVSIPLIVIFSAAFLYLVDRFLLRRFTTTHIFLL